MTNEENIVKIVLDELRDRNLLKENKRSAFSNTELLLYNYNNLEKSIHENELEMQDLREYGLPKKSKSVVVMNGSTTTQKDPELHLIEERISHLKQSNARTRAIIQKINRLIKLFENPKYPDLIQRIYFDNKSREEIAEIYQCDVTTVARNKSKIVNEIKTVLFPSEIINELGC